MCDRPKQRPVEGGRWRSVGSVTRDASGHKMVDHVLASTSDIKIWCQPVCFFFFRK